MTTDMKLVVIESPLAGDFQKNRRYALWCAYDCYQRMESAYASHLFFPQFLRDSDPAERTFGMKAGLAWAAMADIQAFYLDLGWSNGMRAAKEGRTGAGPRIEERRLPRPLMIAFESEGYPMATDGFHNL
jgi:hypothetical protein